MELTLGEGGSTRNILDAPPFGGARHRRSRRAFMGGAAALRALVATGCSGQESRQPTSRDAAATNRKGAEVSGPAMIVYRDPGCGCCEEWAERAREAGFRVTVSDNRDMPAIKRKYAVPEALASCHTALVGNYVVEGHVPLAAVRRLLDQRPAGLKGIAVPGMPRGSPGMEIPDGSTDAFKVSGFDQAGRISAFA